MIIPTLEMMTLVLLMRKLINLKRYLPSMVWRVMQIRLSQSLMDTSILIMSVWYLYRYDDSIFSLLYCILYIMWRLLWMQPNQYFTHLNVSDLFLCLWDMWNVSLYSFSNFPLYIYLNKWVNQEIEDYWIWDFIIL